MKRYLITAAILAAVTPALGQSSPPQLCQQFNQKGECIVAPGGGSGALVSGTTGVTTISNTTSCLITYTKGNLHTEGCDFSLALIRVRITPGDRDNLKIEADQIRPITTSSTIQSLSR